MLDLAPQRYVINNDKIALHEQFAPKDVLVFFKAEWCDRCAELYPMFKRLEEVMTDQVFGVTDIGSNDHLTNAIRTMTKINHVPVIALFSKGVFKGTYSFDKNTPQNIVSATIVSWYYNSVIKPSRTAANMDGCYMSFDEAYA